jgi:hypothetical protein
VLAKESRAATKPHHVAKNLTCTMVSMRNHHDTESKPLVMSTLNSRQDWRQACNSLAEAWTLWKLSWIMQPLMNVLWLWWMSPLSRGASLLASALDRSLLITWINEIGLKSLMDDDSSNLGSKTRSARLMPCRLCMSQCRNALNTCMMLVRTTGDATCRKCVIKPFGLGALSSYKSLITTQISASVKGQPSSHRSILGRLSQSSSYHLRLV